MHLTAVFYMEASFEVVPETSRLDDNNSAVQLAACCALLGVVNSADVLQRLLRALPPTHPPTHRPTTQAYNSFLIYTQSALIEQTTPEIHSIYDAKAGVSL